MTFRVRVGLFSLLLCLAGACGTSEAPPTPLPPTPSLQALALPQATLPPTWTPPPSLTPSRTPTRTPTFTLTPTPVPTLTRTAADICARFTVISQPTEGAALAYGGFLGFSWANAPPDALVVLTLRGRDGEEITGAFRPDNNLNASFPLTSLPQVGRYTWRLTLYLEPYGEICPLEGTFIRETWWARPLENPFAPPFARP